MERGKDMKGLHASYGGLSLYMWPFYPQPYRHQLIAFLEWNRGKLKVTRRASDGKEFEVIVPETGFGLTEHSTDELRQSVGLELVELFVDRRKGIVETAWHRATEVRGRYPERGANKKRRSDAE